MSLPLRKCGLKLPNLITLNNLLLVTSLAEVWIETANRTRINVHQIVTSLAEVWIETGAQTGSGATASGHFPCGSVD